MVERFNEAKRLFDIKSLAPKVSDSEGAESNDGPRFGSDFVPLNAHPRGELRRVV